MSGRARKAFFSDWMCFRARIFSWARRERRCFCRLILAIRAFSASMAPVFILSMRSRRIRRAIKRFSAWDLSCWHLTERPVGRCTRNTQEEVLLTFWPPGPEDLIKVSRRSLSLTPSRAIRSCRASSFSGEIFNSALPESHFYTLFFPSGLA